MIDLRNIKKDRKTAKASSIITENLLLIISDVNVAVLDITTHVIQIVYN